MNHEDPVKLLGACGDDAASTAELEADSGQHCEELATCEDGRDAEGCKSELACLEEALRPDMLAKTVACESARVCDSHDDACYSLEAQGLTRSAGLPGRGLVVQMPGARPGS